MHRKPNISLGYLLKRGRSKRSMAESALLHGRLDQAVTAYRELDEVLRTLQSLGYASGGQIYKASEDRSRRPYLL